MTVVEQKPRLDGVASAIRLPKQDCIAILQAKLIDLIAQISSFMKKHKIVTVARRILEAGLNAQCGSVSV